MSLEWFKEQCEKLQRALNAPDDRSNMYVVRAIYERDEHVWTATVSILKAGIQAPMDLHRAQAITFGNKILYEGEGMPDVQEIVANFGLGGVDPALIKWKQVHMPAVPAKGSPLVAVRQGLPPLARIQD